MDKQTLIQSCFDREKAIYTIKKAIEYEKAQMYKAIDTQTDNFAVYYLHLKESITNAYTYHLISDEETETLLDHLFTKDRNQFLKDFEIYTEQIVIFSKLEQRIFINDNDLFKRLQQSKTIEIQIYDYEFDEEYYDALKIRQQQQEEKPSLNVKRIVTPKWGNEGKESQPKPIQNKTLPETQKEMDLTKIFNDTTVDEKNVLHLPNYQYDRKTYTEIKKQIEAIGGKWKGGKTQGFVFPESTDTAKVKDMLVSGVDLAERKKKYQFFGTPPEVADYILEYLPKECTETGFVYIKDTDKVLEPSAGQGSIINAIHRINPNVMVDCFEAMAENKEVLQTLSNVNILGDDFLQSDTNIKYDLIVANPPFANNQDIDHVVRMYEHLKPSGTLISIMSPHFIMASDKKSKAFRWFINHETAETHYLEEGAFQESGTNIRTAFVIIHKETFADNFNFDEIISKVSKEKIDEKLNNDMDLKKQLQKQYEDGQKPVA